MKLRNLLFGTMIACAFVACSNDDDPISGGGENGDGKTILTAQFDVPTATKAVDDSDNQINSLHMLVFSNGSLEVIGELKQGTTNVAEASVNLADKKVLMLANVDIPSDVRVGDTESAVFTALSKAQALAFNETATALSMNSKLYTNVTVTPEKTNYLGWATAPDGGVLVGGITDATSTVKLYRNAAKVVLTTIKAKEGYTDDVTRVPYKDPRLEVSNVYILQANGYSKIAPGDGAVYGSTELTGNYISGAFLTASDIEGDMYALQTATLENSYIAKIEGIASKDNSVDVNKRFYVYENTSTARDASTLLVVAGTFSYENQSGARVTVDGTRYYPIAIGQTKASFSEAANALLDLRSVEANTPGIYRNLQYNVSLTVVGPGYARPTGGGDPTMLDAKVEVVAYGEVNQDVEI